MRITWDNIQANAVAFSKRWQGITSEKQQDQGFIEALLRVFGVEDPRSVGTFQEKTRINSSTKWIDYLWKNKIAIEMKSKGENLDGAFEQLRQYMYSIPEEATPDLWLVCDFENMRLSRRSTNETWDFKTKDLRKHIKKFADIAGYTTERIRDDQVEVNVKAAEKMAKLHDSLRENGYEGHELEVYLVRLLFCMFADDTRIFSQDSLLRYFEKSNFDGSDLSERIGKLFEVLNMPEEIRIKKTLLSDELKQFRYINGGLFKDLLPSAEFDAKMRRTLIDCMNFDWNKISPAIFGAMFQGVMDKNQRRELGAHYTSEENILKLINPLFMDDLWQEFDRVKTDPAALGRFHDKIARLKFLDPACGCGNFLIIAYRELRMLELEILKMKTSTDQLTIDITPMLKVSVEQFYGIEYEDFPCQIATVGMWLIDHQMNLRVSEQFGQYYARLPLTQSATIVHGNALRIDWADVAPQREISYILGNPPFVGYSLQNKEQKEDMLSVFGDKYKGAGKMDYVCAWYKKAADYIRNTNIKCAFVSTNSISQGEQVALLWKPLIEQGIYLNFAYRTFKWTNEAKGKAAVYCVILGFSAHPASPLFKGGGGGEADDGGFQVRSRSFRYNPELKLPARYLRTDATKQENHLWYDFLNNFTPRFSRQRRIGNYILDFYCHEAALAIELDGSQHYEPDAIEHDKARTEYLNGIGIEVLRFDNKEIDKSFSDVCAKITETVGKRTGKPPSATTSPPPPLKSGLFGGNSGVIYDGGEKIFADNINPYLINAPTVFIENRTKPLFDVPEMNTGNRPADGGNLIIETEDYDDFIAKEINAKQYIRRLIGSEDYINNKKRYCLWLVGVPPSELRQMPEVMKRIAACKQNRENAQDEGRRKLADTPALFREVFNPDSFLLIPRHSSENRRYIPIGFLDKNYIPHDSALIIPNASLYHFGILTSNVHMAWVRTVCGRLKSDYRYSKDIVYNNFPWPTQQSPIFKGGGGDVVADGGFPAIENLAQAVLDARALYPDSSLADLYDPLTMPPELSKAHKALDSAVMKLYGFSVKDTTEAQCVAALMEKYRELTSAGSGI